jgi:hypothetical protein
MKSLHIEIFVIKNNKGSLGTLVRRRRVLPPQQQ